ncbi:MAG: MerR family transcriptional regulator [Microvirga sp.]|jgi:DNA-binding transcriptional MerR regulator
MENLRVEAAPSSTDARRAGEARSRGYSIGDLAREFGVSLRTLRFYEDRGLLKPQRAGASRLYDGAQRARLELILKGKQLGFTLAEIQRLLERPERGEGAPKLRLSRKQIDDQLAHLERQKAEIEGAIAELQAQRQRALSS